MNDLERIDTQALQTQQNYNVVFQIVLPIKHKDYFEKEWLIETHQFVSAYKGYRHRTVHLLSQQAGYLEYAICLSFDSVENLNRWIVSKDRASQVKKIRKMGMRAYRINQYGGLQHHSDSESGAGSQSPSKLSADNATASSGDIESASIRTIDDKVVTTSSPRIELQDSCELIPRPLPPPKWKLAILIFFSVVMSVFCFAIGGSIPAMLAVGLPLGLAIFVTILQIVPLMVYAILPIFISIPFVNAWLRQQRDPSKMHPLLAMLDQGLQIFAPKKNTVPSEILARIDKLEGRLDRLRRVNHSLTEKLDKMQPPPDSDTANAANAGNAAVTSKLSAAIENHKPEKNAVTASEHGTTNITVAGNDAVNDAVIDDAGGAGASGAGSVLPLESAEEADALLDKTDYHRATLRPAEITAAASAAALARQVTNGIDGDDDDDEDNEDNGDEDEQSEGTMLSAAVPRLLHSVSRSTTENALLAAEPLTMVVRHYVKWEKVLDFEKWTDDIEAEMSNYPGFQGMVRIAPKREGDPYINSFTFDSLANMMAFSAKSIQRLHLLKRLEPMLEATSQAELNQERVIQDAFTELFVNTGESAAARPPPLWKTCCLTVVPLFIIIWQGSTSLTGILVNEGVHALVTVVITVAINVMFNVYIGVPLMQMEFGAWLQAPRPHRSSPSDEAEGGGGGGGGVAVLYHWWRCAQQCLGQYLDDGFPRWMQYTAVALYLGLNVGLGLAFAA